MSRRQQSAADAFADEEKRVEKRKQQGYMPRRFFISKTDAANGEGCEIIILDDDIDSGFHIREHSIQGSDGSWGNYETCLADEGVGCPICKREGKEGYMVLFLTVMVKRPWTSKRTNETHEYSKMLLPIKRSQFPKFRKYSNIAKKNHGTFRGVMLYMERPNEDKSASTGEPVPLEDGTAFDFYTEDDLISEFGHDAIVGRDKKVIKEANADIEVFDYRKLFPKPDVEEVLDRYNISPEAGSREDLAKDFEEDDIPMEHEGDSEPPTSEGDKPNAILELAEQCDESEDESNTVLEALAEKHELDYLDYSTWVELATELIDKGAEIPQAKKATKKVAKKAAKKTATRRRRSGGSVPDGGW